MSRSGKNNKGGRPKGKKSQTTIDREAAIKAFRDRVAKMAQRLFDKQMQLAEGQSFLYKIHTNKKGIKEKAELIEDELTIRAYLDGELNEAGSDDYYFITTKEPDNRAIDSMLDRTFGKSTQPLAGDKDGGPIVVKVVNYGN